MTTSKKHIHHVRRTSTRAIQKPHSNSNGSKLNLLINSHSRIPFIPQYSSVETLYNHNTKTSPSILGEHYTRGLSDAKCIDRFKNAKQLAETRQARVVKLEQDGMLENQELNYVENSSNSNDNNSSPLAEEEVNLPSPIAQVIKEPTIVTENYADDTGALSFLSPSSDFSNTTTTTTTSTIMLDQKSAANRVLRQRLDIKLFKYSDRKRRIPKSMQAVKKAPSSCCSSPSTTVIATANTNSSSSPSPSNERKIALPTKSFLPLSSRHEQQEKIGHIRKIQIGGYLIDVWYLAPYPEEYSRLEVLFLCEFCLKYMKSSYIARRHKIKCPMKHPPGDEIYRDGIISIFEVDGRKNKIYCQNLCLLAKMFLDHKTLYYDVEPFLFYILAETDQEGCHFVGYFSKEKQSLLDYNLSCIMTLPAYQRKGYGQFLIDFSYLLSRKEGKIGSPEKPLSDLGLISYRKYWLYAIKKQFLQHPSGQPITIEELSKESGMTCTDIISTLKFNKMLKKENSGQYTIIVNEQDLLVQQQLTTARTTAKNELLTWVPYLVATKEGDAGILNIPRDNTTMISSSDISMDAIIPSSKTRNSSGQHLRKRREKQY